MLKQFYNIGLKLYALALRLAAFMHPKAKLWVQGRRLWRQELRQAIGEGGNWIWLHAASLGEFEQGRPLIELIKKHKPEKKILVSFFSPSGYEIRKNYPLADHVCYLPMDHPKNARNFIQILDPELVVFIKYELWLNYLFELKQRNIPALLIAASLQADSSFLTSPLKRLYKKAFLSFQAIFTQDQQTVNLLAEFCKHPHIIPSSDTRYDRVYATQQAAEELPLIADFVRDRLCIVAGSSWPKGEKALLSAFAFLKKEFDLCLIFAPHEINSSRISQWKQAYPNESWVLSEGSPDPEKGILWVDEIGLLARLYRYADLAYIGGALGGHGLHNVLEATAFGTPVLFGPKHQDKPEALALMEIGGAYVVEDAGTMAEIISRLLKDAERCEALRKQLQTFVAEQAGASQQIWAWILASPIAIG